MTKGTALSGAAFVLAAGLVVQQLVAPPEPTSEIAAPAAKTAALEAKVQALETRVAELERSAQEPRPAPRPATREGSAGAAAAPESGAGPASAAVASRESGAPPEVGGPTSSQAQPVVTKTVLAAVDERINEAVDEKLEEIKQKWNKKPQLKTVAKLLELDERQERVIEETVRAGQKQIHSVLAQPTANGTSLLDELVEVMARGQTPEAGALWGQWLGRLQTEKVPGTDLTYAARLEQTKAEVRESFRQVMSPAQYTEFEEWAFDPTEVEGISESPWSDFGQRVAARAAELAQQRQE